MNKQTTDLLEQYFDTAFAAPNGIKKLRELILTLAMQGKLVAQDHWQYIASRQCPDLLLWPQFQQKFSTKRSRIFSASSTI